MKHTAYYVYWLLTDSGDLLYVDVGRDKEKYAKLRAAREGRRGELYDKIRAVWLSGGEVRANHVPISYDYTTALDKLTTLEQRADRWWLEERRITTTDPCGRPYYRKRYSRG